jgi:protease I
MSKQLQGRKVAILAADGVEKVELERPRAAVEGVGGQVQLLSLKTGEIQAREHDLEPAGTFPVDRAVADASVDEFDALVLPGGTVNPDKLRLDESAAAFVRDFVRSGKPVAAICHGLARVLPGDHRSIREHSRPHLNLEGDPWHHPSRIRLRNSRIHYLKGRRRAPRIRHHRARDCQTRTTSSLEG